jgi:hypothetical protein
MSLICHYVRTGEAALEVVSRDPEAIFGDLADLPEGSEVIDIDKAYDALEWLGSPVKRAGTLHSAKLIREPDWPASEARASVARLNEMVVDDVFAAIHGIADERVEGFDFGLGPARIFRPDRVRSLALAVGALDEAELRRNADFVVMDRDLVQPDDWQEEGEDILASYILPALRRLKSVLRGSGAVRSDAGAL